MPLIDLMQYILADQSPDDKVPITMVLRRDEWEQLAKLGKRWGLVSQSGKPNKNLTLRYILRGLKNGTIVKKGKRKQKVFTK